MAFLQFSWIQGFKGLFSKNFISAFDVLSLSAISFFIYNSTFGGANYISIPPPIGAFDYYEGRNMQSLRPLSDREWNL